MGLHGECYPSPFYQIRIPEQLGRTFHARTGSRMGAQSSNRLGLVNTGQLLGNITESKQGWRARLDLKNIPEACWYDEAMVARSNLLLLLILFTALRSLGVSNEPEVVSFRSGEITLQGTLYKPEGNGPFPAVVYNHGSAPGMLSQQAFEALGPVFASHGWVFFGPYRRGQGLSAAAGPYIGDEIAAAKKKGGMAAGAATMVRLLETDHLNDQLAALAWLRTQKFVEPDRIAVAGNSFGGIEVVLGAERGWYCAAVDSAGAAQSWGDAPEVRDLMIRSVRNSRTAIFFFQAENDYDLAPSRTLSAAMKDANKEYEIKIYPPYGDSTQDGHTFGYFGGSVWGPDVFRFLGQHCPKTVERKTSHP
jgi:carboxymethylenebutenolidase